MLTSTITSAQTGDLMATPSTPTDYESNDSASDISINDEVAEHIREIYAYGQELGNRPAIFSKVGDSLTVSRSFLYPFGIDNYNLGEYTDLETVVEQFSALNAHIGNSFINESLAAGEGWSANSALTPSFTNERYCDRDEAPLLCEYREVRPTIAIIMFGTNDVGFRTVTQFESDMQAIINFTQELGIIPILSTIPNRPRYEQQVVEFNAVIHQLASDNLLPMVDLHRHTIGLPRNGLTDDNVHLSSSPFGVRATATFTPDNLQYGYVMRNLLTLQALYDVMKIVDTE